ncbi:MAG: hypothetical protein LBR53_09205 [Deltaproteobacteria bacterium]|nr:hypothetical protein [Deltaproteobacteria bacterium]
MSEAYRSDQRYDRFIQGLKEGKTVDQSRREATLNWNSLYKMRKSNETFREAWDEALIQGGRKFPTDNDPRFDVFLEKLRDGKTVAHAMSEAGLYWRRLYQHKHDDPEFMVAWDAAMVAGGRQVEETTDPRFGVFLKALAERRSFTGALAASGLDCKTLYDYKQRNRKFQEACQKIARDHDIRSEFKDPRYEVFLGGLKLGKTINAAMLDAALNWKTLYAFKNSNAEFRAAWDEAMAASGRVITPPRTLTDETLALFLENIAAGMTVKDSAEKAGVTLASVYKRSKKDPELEKAWDEAYRKGRNKNRKVDEEIDIFLSQIEGGAKVNDAAKASGKDLTTFYRLRKKDFIFAERWRMVVAKKKKDNKFKKKLALQKTRKKKARGPQAEKSPGVETAAAAVANNVADPSSLPASPPEADAKGEDPFAELPEEGGPPPDFSDRD